MKHFPLDGSSFGSARTFVPGPTTSVGSFGSGEVDIIVMSCACGKRHYSAAERQWEALFNLGVWCATLNRLEDKTAEIGTVE